MPGNAEALIEWYNEGAGGAVDWGESGDFDQCVGVASGYMDDDQARGFCQLRHMDATGMTTSEHAAEEKSISLDAPLATGLVPFDLAGQGPAVCPQCGLLLDTSGLCPVHGTAVKGNQARIPAGSRGGGEFAPAGHTQAGATDQDVRMGTQGGTASQPWQQTSSITSGTDPSAKQPREIPAAPDPRATPNVAAPQPETVGLKPGDVSEPAAPPHHPKVKPPKVAMADTDATKADQAHVPAGSPAGGQFASGSGDGAPRGEHSGAPSEQPPGPRGEHSGAPSEGPAPQPSPARPAPGAAPRSTYTPTPLKPSKLKPAKQPKPSKAPKAPKVPTPKAPKVPKAPKPKAGKKPKAPKVPKPKAPATAKPTAAAKPQTAKPPKFVKPSRGAAPKKPGGTAGRLLQSASKREQADLLLAAVEAELAKRGVSPFEGIVKYSEDQERDDQGRWVGGGGSDEERPNWRGTDWHGAEAPGGKPLPDRSPKPPEMRDLLREQGGFTLNVRSGQAPTSGYVVALPGHSAIMKADQFMTNDKAATSFVTAFMADKQSEIAQAGYIGGWLDTVHNEVVLDPVENVQDKATATALGASRDQQAIWDVVAGAEIPTGGTGGREGS